MNKEIRYIIHNLQTTLSGEPWFGRSVYSILEETDETKVYTRPGNTEHSLIELLYHMITWSDFCLKQLENATSEEIKEVEEKDWREIDPKIHDWKKGMEQLKEIHRQIIFVLETKDDAFLSEIVKERKFNYRFMLNGLIQHNIYHLGQVAYVKKLFG